MRRQSRWMRLAGTRSHRKTPNGRPYPTLTGENSEYNAESERRWLQHHDTPGSARFSSLIYFWGQYEKPPFRFAEGDRGNKPAGLDVFIHSSH
jgi:hypothetical protein